MSKSKFCFRVLLFHSAAAVSSNQMVKVQLSGKRCWEIKCAYLIKHLKIKYWPYNEMILWRVNWQQILVQFIPALQPLSASGPPDPACWLKTFLLFDFRRHIRFATRSNLHITPQNFTPPVAHCLVASASRIKLFMATCKSKKCTI